MTMRANPSAILPPTFFDRQAEIVARDLPGRRLVRWLAGKRVALTITETEAYLGPHDLACHAARGRTARTEVLYGPPGTLYIYLVYGLHWMLNVVTGPAGYPAAVLIRGAGELSGPGKLARGLVIDGALNGRCAAPQSGLWFERVGARSPSSPLAASASITRARAGQLASCGSCCENKGTRTAANNRAAARCSSRDLSRARQRGDRVGIVRDHVYRTCSAGSEGLDDRRIPRKRFGRFGIEAG